MKWKVNRWHFNIFLWLIVGCEENDWSGGMMFCLSVDQIFEVMSDCQTLHPDEEDDFSGELCGHLNIKSCSWVLHLCLFTEEHEFLNHIASSKMNLSTTIVILCSHFNTLLRGGSWFMLLTRRMVLRDHSEQCEIGKIYYYFYLLWQYSLMLPFRVFSKCFGFSRKRIIGIFGQKVWWD
jgi:hypothetical protein